jgi:hypothetical protein
MPEKHPQFGKWNCDELRKAEATALRFLEENSIEISDSMRAKVKFLEILLQKLSLKKTSFPDRLEYLARVSEVAGLIQEDADGFFQLASEPVVARLLGTLPPSK